MIIDDTIAYLVADPALVILLGGEHVYPGHIKQGQHLPSVNVDHGGEIADKEVGYRTSKKRDHEQIVVVDVWTQQSVQHRAEICERLDELLIPEPITNTWGWDKISDSRPWDDALQAYHATMRYRVMYTLLD